MEGIVIQRCFAFVLALLTVGCAPMRATTVVLPPTFTRATPSTHMNYGITRAEPRYIDNQHHGIRIVSIEADSLAETMGLRGGDVLLSMADVPCTGVRSCRLGERRMRRALHHGHSFVLIIERQATLLRLVIEYDSFRPLFK